MTPSWKLSRRHFLRGLGATIALPSLDVMAATSKAAAAHPTRMAFFFVPKRDQHGALADRRKQGANYNLPSTLEPLAPLQREFNVLTGLTQDKGRANDDGAGDHARSGSVFLTGAQPLKSEGAEIRFRSIHRSVRGGLLGESNAFPFT